MENKEARTPIRGFHDLEVYQVSYRAAITVCQNIVPNLPVEEKFDLCDQLRRSSKAVPRLIAEGYAKRHQKRGFQKYLDDDLAEINETLVGLYQVRDLYLKFVDPNLLNILIETYERLAKQVYRLAEKWQTFRSFPLPNLYPSSTK